MCTIYNKNSYGKNQGANVRFWRRVCADNNTPRVLGKHLPRRVAMLAVEIPKQSNKSYKETQKAGGRCSMAFGTFGSSVFGDQKKKLQKMFAGQTPRMWLAIRNP